MRAVMARGNTTRPEWVDQLMPGAQTFISPGHEYEVHAMSIFRGHVFLQIVDDTDVIAWYPSWFFDIADPTLSKDWICTIAPGDVQMIMGPPFVAATEADYNRMVELDGRSVELFWNRVDALRGDQM